MMRARINRFLELQKGQENLHNSLHASLLNTVATTGMNVIASPREPVAPGMIRVYFLSGVEESITIPRSWISVGWEQ